VLGAIAFFALVLWLAARPVTARACGDAPVRHEPLTT
jgi:hypothetical protein